MFQERLDAETEPAYQNSIFAMELSIVLMDLMRYILTQVSGNLSYHLFPILFRDTVI